MLLAGNLLYQANLAATAASYVGKAGPSDKSKFQSQATRVEAQAGISLLLLGAVWAAAGLVARVTWAAAPAPRSAQDQ